MPEKPENYLVENKETESTPEDKEIISPAPEHHEKRSAVEKGREFLNDTLQITGRLVIDYLNPKSSEGGIMRYISTPIALLGGGALLKLYEYEPRFFEEMKRQVYQMIENLQAGNLQWSDEKNVWASMMIITGMTLAASGHSLYEIVRIVTHNVKRKIDKKQTSIQHE